MKLTTLAKDLENHKDIFQSKAVKHLIFMVGISVSVALGIVLYMSIQEPIYRPLDYQVTSGNMSSIIDALDKSGIEYKINEKDGIILVPANELQKAKFKLSSLGVPKGDSFTYDFLNDKNGLANSQFIDGMRYLQALENDLAKTINSLEGVSGAKIHIAIPKNNVYSDENNRVTASVMLNVSPGFNSNSEKVRSILRIVADSVSGLDPKDVSITDQYGHLLSDSINQDSVYSAAQLTYQNSIQSYYEKRIESMLAPIIGENKITVRVNANIDFTQEEDAKEQYDPDNKVVHNEQTNSEQSPSGGGASGPPGSLSNTPPGDGKSSSPSAGGGSAKSQTNKTYELSKTVTYKKSNFAKVLRLSAAIVIDNAEVYDPKTKKTISKPLDKDMIAKVTELVKATIGYEEQRGDKVTVINSTYTPVKGDLTPATARHVWDEAWFWEWVKRIVGILLGFSFLIVLYRKLSKLGHSIKSENAAKLSELGYDDITSALARTQEIQKEGIDKLKELASTEPARVAMVMKNWVGKQ